jgi:MEMO1 family protein
MCAATKKVKEPRVAAVSGSFYSADKAQLSAEIHSALSHAKRFKEQDIRAIIVPHAGYIYSGDVAADAYRTLHKKYKNVFLIGSSHHTNFNGVSIYNRGNYLTPLGEIVVNEEIVDNLLTNNDFITYKPEAHTKEHTLEVQLPFLQSIYKDELRIVPIIVATSEFQTIQRLSQALAPYFNVENLFVISTDLSHFPKYEDANRVDANILNALVKNSSEALINAITENENSNTPELLTSACGWSSLLTLLQLTQNSNYNYELLRYKNSGDSKYGDKNRVVGYGALRVYKTDESSHLSQEEREELKALAQLTLNEAVLNNQRLNVDPKRVSPKLKEHLGVFTTLTLNGKLKGCIGRFEPNQPLYEVLIDMTIAASRYDERFTPIDRDELKDIEIELSVLTPRVKVNSIDDIILGKHGIYVSFGSKNGTYLPQVATDMNWSKEQFFTSCCRDKAGIDANDCQNAELYVYEAIVF